MFHSKALPVVTYPVARVSHGRASASVQNSLFFFPVFPARKKREIQFESALGTSVLQRITNWQLMKMAALPGFRDDTACPSFILPQIKKPKVINSPASVFQGEMNYCTNVMC